MKVKQVIVVRKDLNMRKGKLAAQVAHASMKVLLDLMATASLNENYEVKSITINREVPLFDWINGIFTKIVVGCNNEQELYDIQEKCNNKNILNAIIIDEGNTEFHGVKTSTCIAIGPDYSDVIDEITGEYKLL
jgi:PTH2 family peptidyl-tRNA hydrolase